MIFNRAYLIDWTRIHIMLLPMLLRQPRQVAWIRSLFKPLETLHTRFINYRRVTNYKLDHNAQVFSMENVLNDSFDVQLRRIYIVDGIYLDNVYFYNPEENFPVHFYNSTENEDHPIFYDESELQQLNVDFVVVLPLELQGNFSEDSPQMLRLKALIDFYRLPDKTYQIKFD